MRSTRNETVRPYVQPEFRLAARAALRRDKIRRQQQIRREITLLMGLGVVLILIVLALVFGMSSSAASDKEESFKYYTNITVQFGQSFDDVVDEYYSAEHYKDRDSFVRELVQINHLPIIGEEGGKVVRPGDHLIVPYYSAEFH